MSAMVATNTMLISDIKEQINAVAQSSGYSCKTVSWEDCTRGTTADGDLSCWGANISDVRLWERNGTLLYTVRSKNWNERFGYVAAKHVSVVVGNHMPKDLGAKTQVKSISLQQYLNACDLFADYAGLQSESFANNERDDLFTIRFQTVFLPVDAKGDETKLSDAPTTTEFCTEVYNYNSRSDENPRNALLLCTAQGTSFQQDGAGSKQIFHHEVDQRNEIHRYWLEAEQSRHKVGGSQSETEQEAAAASARGKSTAMRIGTAAMEKRFNVQMLIQLPVVMPEPRILDGAMPYYGGGIDMCGDDFAEEVEEEEEEECCFEADDYFGTADDFTEERSDLGEGDELLVLTPPVGLSNAARVSRGSEEDVWNGLTKRDMQRDPDQNGTITVTMYYTVVGGIPSEEDVRAAILDLDQLYDSCEQSKELKDAHEVTTELTGNVFTKIVKKIFSQPYAA